MCGNTSRPLIWVVYCVFGVVSRVVGLVLCRGLFLYSVMCVLWGLGYFWYRGRIGRRLLLGGVCLSFVVACAVGFVDSVK